MKRNQRITRNARVQIKNAIRERDITKLEDVMEIVKPHFLFNKDAAEEKELRELSRKILSSIKDENGIRNIFSFRDNEGAYRYLNVTVTQNLKALEAVDDQLKVKYYGINKGRKKIELERQRVLGQLSLDDVHNKN